MGNRTDSNAVIGTGNRLTVFGDLSLGYDADGNLTSKSRSGLSQSLTWNSLGQLTSVTTNGNTTSFAYDAFGRRVRMDAPGYTRHYVHDGPHVFAELNGSYGFVAGYAYRPGVDRPLLMNRGGSMYYYGTDLMGTVRGIMGADNVTYRYGPWGGTQYDDSGTLENPLRFAGAWRDGETYLYYMRARYYDPDVGRFISEDPIGLQGGINLYAYAENNPVNPRDPSGLVPHVCGEGRVQVSYWDGPVFVIKCGDRLDEGGGDEEEPGGSGEWGLGGGGWPSGTGSRLVSPDELPGTTGQELCADAALAAAGASVLELTWLIPVTKAGWLASKATLHYRRARRLGQGVRSSFEYFEGRLARSEARAVLGSVPASQINAAPIDFAYTAAATPTPAHLPLSPWDFVPGAGGYRAILAAREMCAL